jgi:transcriptional regulator with XRE-family HTH domain
MIELRKTAWAGPLVYHTVEQIDHVATGAAMRQLRKAHNISLREIARRMGLSAPFISDLERGRRNWNANMALQYMKAETSAFIAQIQDATKKAHKVNLQLD